MWIINTYKIRITYFYPNNETKTYKRQTKNTITTRKKNEKENIMKIIYKLPVASRGYPRSSSATSRVSAAKIVFCFYF